MENFIFSAMLTILAENLYQVFDRFLNALTYPMQDRQQKYLKQALLNTVSKMLS